MSNNNPQQPSKNIQYASTTPSVASLLNLPQVQDKKKQPTGLAGVSGLASVSGLVGKPGVVRPAAALGLAPTKQPLMTLKLKKTEASVVPNISETKELKVNIAETKTASVTDTKAIGTTETFRTEEHPHNLKTIVKPAESTVVKAKVEKPKAEKYSKQTPTPAPSTNTNPNDHFDPTHWRLFVGNLGPEVTESLLLTTFKNPYPSTSRVLIVRDWKTQKSKGYAFVAFADGKEFLRALKEMNGKWIGNRQFIIKKSEHQPKFQ